jgi:hypothetical protein
LLDKAAKKAGHPDNYPDDAAYGREVHKNMEDLIRAFNENPPKGHPGLGTPELTIGKDGSLDVKLNAKDSIRPDLENARKREIGCVYEFKTLGARLSGRRMNKVALYVGSIDAVTAETLVVMQVKPRIQYTRKKRQ